jgi:hypothetical protein
MMVKDESYCIQCFWYTDDLPIHRWLPEEQGQETSSLSMCEKWRTAPENCVSAIQIGELIFYTIMTEIQAGIGGHLR